VHLFTQDQTTGGANGPWVDHGNLNAAGPGHCRDVGQDVVNFTPANGHIYVFKATDTQQPYCPVHDPTQGTCIVTVGGFQGDAAGFNRWDAHDSNTIIW
jgi:hypothetical protein